MAIELAEHDATHGTHGNKRAWLELAAHAVTTKGYRVVLNPVCRAWFLRKMAETGLGDYSQSTTEEQDHVIITCIDTAVLFMA